MPTPKQLLDRKTLVEDLKNCDWRAWFVSERSKESKSDLQKVIENAVGANTFRAFKRHRGNSPSSTFRDWAKHALDARTLEKLWVVKSQREYDDWLSHLVLSFTKRWNSKMGKMSSFGPYFKLPNLLIKRLCLYRDVSPKEFNQVVGYLHVPLDSSTILAVKNCVKGVGTIPNTATMKFIENRKMYDAFQSGIREMALEAKVPPIALDCLAWDAKRDTRIFEEKNFDEQAKTMKMTARQFRKQLKAHLRLAKPRERAAVLKSRLGLLKRILDQYQR